jgi:hypothetical protein
MIYIANITLVRKFIAVKLRFNQCAQKNDIVSR